MLYQTGIKVITSQKPGLNYPPHYVAKLHKVSVQRTFGFHNKPILYLQIMAGY